MLAAFDRRSTDPARTVVGGFVARCIFGAMQCGESGTHGPRRTESLGLRSLPPARPAGFGSPIWPPCPQAPAMAVLCT